jgi:hypothetical protein
MSIFRILNVSFPLLAVVSGLYALKFLDKPSRIVFALVCIGLCTETLIWVAVKLGSRNTLPGLHFYVMVEFLLWAIFYMYQLQGFIKKIYLWSIIIVFEILCALNTIFLQELTEYPITRAFEGLIIVFFSILTYYRIMDEERIKKLTYSPVIWINTAVLIYFSGYLFFNTVFTPLLQKNYEALKFIGIYITGSLNVIYYSSIAVGLLIQKFKLSTE